MTEDELDEFVKNYLKEYFSKNTDDAINHKKDKTLLT